MKKTYNNPEMKVVMLNTKCHMLSESLDMKGNYDSNTVNIASRRGRGSWDDDDDYDE